MSIREEWKSVIWIFILLVCCLLVSITFSSHEQKMDELTQDIVELKNDLERLKSEVEDEYTRNNHAD